MTTLTPASTTGTTKTAVQTATKSLLTSLGSGSGIDTGTLVTSLVEAQFATQTARLTKKAETLTAQISGVSAMKSAITGFANALDTLAKAGSLATQPKSSTATVATATAEAGAKLSGLSATVEVTQIARAQTVASARIKASADPAAADASRTTVLGSGTFTLQLGTASYAADGKSMTALAPSAAAGSSVSFDLTDATPDSIAAAVNKNGAALGITAKVVTDADGATYVSLKGASGAANAFTLTTSGDAALKQVEVGAGAGSTITATAQNAKLSLDGVAVERASNTITDLIPGAKLELAGVGTTNLTADRPTASLKQAVADIADTYNQVLSILKEQTDPVTGPLAGDPAAATMLRDLKGMTLAAINPDGAEGEPRTLAELGVKTARDGTLSVDDARLSTMLTKYPDAVEGMLRDSKSSTTGLPARLQSLSAAATNPTYGLNAAATRYAKAQADVTVAQAKIATDATAATARLTSQYAALNSRVTAYKSIQTFLTGQIAAWNKSDN